MIGVAYGPLILGVAQSFQLGIRQINAATGITQGQATTQGSKIDFSHPVRPEAIGGNCRSVHGASGLAVRKMKRILDKA
jgi:hypothetical protein